MFKVLVPFVLAVSSISTAAFASFASTTCSNSSATITYKYSMSWNTPATSTWKINGKLATPSENDGVIFDKEIEIDSQRTPMTSFTTTAKQLHFTGINEDEEKIEVTAFVICTQGHGI